MNVRGDVGVWVAASQALASIGKEEAATPLIKLLQTLIFEDAQCETNPERQRDPALRSVDSSEAATKHRHRVDAVAETLAGLYHHAAIRPLIEASVVEEWLLLRYLDNLDPHWAKSSAALQTVPWLVEALRTSQHRRTAVQILGVIGGQEALKALVGVLEDESLRYTTLQALVRIDPNWMHSRTAKQALPSLLENVKGDAARTWLLSTMRDPRAIGPVLQELALHDLSDWGCTNEGARLLAALSEIDPDWRTSETVRPLVPILLQRLKEHPRDYEAAHLLGCLKCEAAVEPLISALRKNLEDNSYAVSTHAWALGEIGDQRAVEPLLEALIQIPREAYYFIQEPTSGHNVMNRRGKVERCGNREKAV
jgi:HEAT repeat protein